MKKKKMNIPVKSRQRNKYVFHRKEIKDIWLKKSTILENSIFHWQGQKRTLTSAWRAQKNRHFDTLLVGVKNGPKALEVKFSSMYQKPYNTEHIFWSRKTTWRNFIQKKKLQHIVQLEKLKKCKHYRTGWVNGNTLNKL